MKKMILVLVGLLALGMAIPAFASDTGFDWVQWHQKRVELQKELVEQQVEAGLITPAQAELWQQNMDARQKAIEANPAAFVPGNFGRGFQRGGGMMMGGCGMRGFAQPFVR